MFLNGGRPHRWIGKGKKEHKSHGWRMAGFAGSSPALGSHISALLAKRYQFAIYRSAHVLDTCNYPIEY